MLGPVLDLEEGVEKHNHSAESAIVDVSAITNNNLSAREIRARVKHVNNRRQDLVFLYDCVPTLLTI